MLSIKTWLFTLIVAYIAYKISSIPVPVGFENSTKFKVSVALNSVGRFFVSLNFFEFINYFILC